MSNLNLHYSLSQARLSTFENALANHPQFNDVAEFYMWNAQISAAFLVPLHFVEVVSRNAIAQAIEIKFGERWPWSAQFERSLPNAGSNHYQHRNELIRTRDKFRHTGQVVAELKFVFWQTMMTKRFYQTLWQNHIHQAFPNFNHHATAEQNRLRVYKDLERIRRLRNRIAHHEPIFNRDLQADYDAITDLIQARCTHTAQWMQAHQQVTPLLSKIKRTQP